MNFANRSGLGWAVGLMLSGLFLLIWNLDLLAAYAPWPEVLLAVALFAITIGFFSGYLGGHAWWRLIPAWIMAALTAMVLLNISPAVADAVIVALIFVGMAAAFLHIYLLHRLDHWWALLPAGFTLVIALVIAASALTQNITLLGALLFCGMGAVFFVLYALSRSKEHWWSLIPGSVLLIFGLVILTAHPEGEATYLRWWPVLLIVAGLVVLWFTDRHPSQQAQSTTARAAAGTPSPTKNTTAAPDKANAMDGRLGDYQQPAPGASVDLLPERDEG
ncbi:MAG TPA: hypothetical protein P5121_15055 [Caldilineaceae bacterium]|nr:hypothetical protein [Caldilineaceae bacterium]